MFKQVKFENMGTKRTAYISRRHVSALVEDGNGQTIIHFAGGWLVVDGTIAEVSKRLGIKIKGMSNGS